jgi:hypothetical protein
MVQGTRSPLPRRKPVFSCVPVSRRARARQIAATVIAQRRRPGGRQLVEAVRDVGTIYGDNHLR